MHSKCTRKCDLGGRDLRPVLSPLPPSLCRTVPNKTSDAAAGKQLRSPRMCTLQHPGGCTLPPSRLRRARCAARRAGGAGSPRPGAASRAAAPPRVSAAARGPTAGISAGTWEQHGGAVRECAARVSFGGAGLVGHAKRCQQPPFHFHLEEVQEQPVPLGAKGRLQSLRTRATDAASRVGRHRERRVRDCREGWEGGVVSGNL